MSDPVQALLLDLLEWIAPRPRPYADVIEAWRTSCPRLPVWEEATDRLRAFDYALPAWTIWPAIVVFGLGILLRAAAQTALGRAWSHTVEVFDEQRLVTTGDLRSNASSALRIAAALGGAPSPSSCRTSSPDPAGPSPPR